MSLRWSCFARDRDEVALMRFPPAASRRHATEPVSGPKTVAPSSAPTMPAAVPRIASSSHGAESIVTWISRRIKP